MSDLLKRSSAMETILSSDFPKKDNIINASKHLSGLDLSQLSSKVRKQFESNILKLNAILQQYDIETFDDYKKITDSHLDSMVNSLKKIALILRQ